MSHAFELTLLMLTTAVTCSCETFNIANSIEWCEGESNCYTLNQLTDKLANLEFSNLTLYFTPGEHSLNLQLVIDHAEDVKMIGSSAKSIIWLQQTDLIISNTNELTIQDVVFVSDNDAETPGFVNIEDCGNVLLIGCTVRRSALRISSKNATITGCTLENTSTHDSYKTGVVISTDYYLYINNSMFVDNKIYPDQRDNAVDISFDNLAHVNNSTFINGYGEDGGGIKIYSFGESLLYITNCEFIGNSADNEGGAVLIPIASNITIVGTSFTSNRAELGGAIHILRNMHLKIVDCTFIDNHATDEESSGAIFIDTPEEGLTGTIVIKDTVFINNSGAGAMSILRRIGSIENTSFINNDCADNHHKILTIVQSTLTMRQVVFSHNKGFVYTFNSKLNITGPVTFRGNVGGAINAVQSQIYIDSFEEILVTNNTASLGGGITLRESELVVRSPITITDNTANMDGGGLYAYQSIIDFAADKRIGESFINSNSAGGNGGGLFAVASTIKLSRSYVTIGQNTALISGGGLYLQENSKIYLLKQSSEIQELHVQLKITGNSAIYGGGIFVADNSTAGELQCRQENYFEQNESYIFPDCFLQAIRLYPSTGILYNMVNTFIINNTAESGSALYGGLLDRCSVSSLAELFYSASGLEYFMSTVTISEGSSITSDPLQVVFCDENTTTILTRKGEVFKISVSAIDQVGNPVKAIIRSSVVTESGVGRLREGQSEQRVGDQCTELEYNVFSQDSSAQVELYADGPCSNLGISKQTISVTFLPCACPVGLQPSKSQIQCECVCDQELQPYQITNCSQRAGTIQLETNIWIGVADYTNGTGYIIHDCPFDYCVEKPVNISLEDPQERDKQCAFNRSGILCGDCQKGLSLVLATSKCRECSNIYLILLIPFALAGIVLVGFILFFNITIATGTIHSLIFYSNLLPSRYFLYPSALTVFISWLNLDLGIETCFYDEMNSQAKVLLQLAFPAYIFLLMILIIVLSRYSNFFATLLSNRNPVAALFTLIFLSYSKLLRFIINALQSTVLVFPSGSRRRVWLYDANVEYFTLSHVPQLIAAVLVLVAGGLLTLQLFFAQWFPRCSKRKLMKWTRNTKYIGFTDTYHAPFTRKHRYWVGLLFLGLIVHNVVSATAPKNTLPVLSMGILAQGLIVLKLLYKKIYKSWASDLLESTLLLNLVSLTYGTLYAQSAGNEHVITTLANVSMGTAAGLFSIIICYHTYKYVYLQSRFYRRHKTDIKNITMKFRENLRRGPRRAEMEELITDKGGAMETPYTTMKSHQQREPDLDVLAPITAADYRSEPFGEVRSKVSKVTHTIVERELGTHTTDTVNT